MFTEDHTAFFADFGVPVTLAGRTVQAVFDNPHGIASVGLSGMAVSQPSLTLATASVPPEVIDWFRYYTEAADPVSLQVTVPVLGANTAYTIVAHEPDGTGMSRLLLEASP